MLSYFAPVINHHLCRQIQLISDMENWPQSFNIYALLDGALVDLTDGALVDLTDGALVDLTDGAFVDLTDGAFVDFTDGAFVDFGLRYRSF
jgi:hypothetical protein